MAIVNRLEAKGYLVRRQSRSDGRKQALNLTDPGRRALSSAKRAIQQHEQWLKSRFTKRSGQADRAPQPHSPIKQCVAEHRGEHDGQGPETIIDDGAMGVGQWLAVLVTMGLNALDGFDVLSISFASPGIAKDWGIDKATLGWVLSMELLGMALGSLLLVAWADKAGRRPTILACLVGNAVGMFGQVTRTASRSSSPGGC